MNGAGIDGNGWKEGLAGSSPAFQRRVLGGEEEPLQKPTPLFPSLILPSEFRSPCCSSTAVGPAPPGPVCTTPVMELSTMAVKLRLSWCHPPTLAAALVPCQEPDLWARWPQAKASSQHPAQPSVTLSLQGHILPCQRAHPTRGVGLEMEHPGWSRASGGVWCEDGEQG